MDELVFRTSRKTGNVFLLGNGNVTASASSFYDVQILVILCKKSKVYLWLTSNVMCFTGLSVQREVNLPGEGRPSKESPESRCLS